jgi:uncharacterized repeat protein (TIGR01451 family)
MIQSRFSAPMETSGLRNGGLVLSALLLVGFMTIDAVGDTPTDVRGFQVADLAITKTDGITIVVPGQIVTYTIVVTNSSDPDVIGATVADIFPPELGGVTYTSMAAGGATGNTAAGAGDINDLVNMPSGSSITYTAMGTLDPAATGTLENTATVTAPAGIVDPDLTNNSATDIDDITPTADLSITKDDGLTTVSPGESLTYEIVVSNAGPSNAVGVVIADAFPANLTGVTFTSVAAGGATGDTAAGSGNINDMVDMPVGSTITYTVMATVSPAAVSTLTNTATVAAPAGVDDPDLTNNSATDTDDLTPTADLSITKDDGQTTVAQGATLTYTIVVTNAGPSDATGASITDVFSAELTGISFTSSATGGATGNTASGNGNISDTVDMPVGSTITYLAMATVAATATVTVDNTATVGAPANVTDPDLTNNTATDSDTIDTPTGQPAPCVGATSGLNLLFSLLFHSPVCGIGCPLMMAATICGIAAMRSTRRRRMR